MRFFFKRGSSSNHASIQNCVIVYYFSLSFLALFHCDDKI